MDIINVNNDERLIRKHIDFKIINKKYGTRIESELIIQSLEDKPFTQSLKMEE